MAGLFATFPFAEIIGLLFIGISLTCQTLSNEIANIICNEGRVIILITMAIFMLGRGRGSILLVVAFVEIARLTSRPMEHSIAKRNARFFSPR